MVSLLTFCFSFCALTLSCSFETTALYLEMVSVCAADLYFPSASACALH